LTTNNKIKALIVITKELAQMFKNISPAPLIAVVVIAAVLQLGLIGADCRQTPIKVAKNFASAFYYLDSQMQDYLCDALAENGEVVSDYLIQKSNEASQRGLSTNYLRHKFLKMHASVIDSGEDTMKVHLTGTTRVCINPVFMLVGKLFNVGDDHPVDETLELVKENNRWRVCASPFGLSPQQ
jgi:hypothetical protein